MQENQEIKLTIDGKEVTAQPGQTVIQAAMDAGIYIPYLCYWPGMKPYGACRMCVVEVEGQRGTPASCTLPAANGMVVNTSPSEVEGLRNNILELLLSEHPHGCLTCHRIELCGPQDICLRHVRVTDRCVVCPKNERCELKDTVRYSNMNMETPLTYNYRNLPIHTNDPFYDRDYNLCIVCARCVRVCDEIRGDSAISLIERSGTVLVGTSHGSSLLESGCEFCGACVDVCPVGALVEREHKWDKALKTIPTTCTHCSVGCQVNLEVDSKGEVIRSIGNWEAKANIGQLCFKGKFGMEFINSKERIKSPLLKDENGYKEISWDEATKIIGTKLKNYSGDKFSLLLGPKVTNEDAYIAQKFSRIIMQSNNIDMATPYGDSLVRKLEESIGNMAGSGSLQELENAECAIVFNANITEQHNVAAIPLKKGRQQQTLNLIVIDPREVELTRYANIWLRPNPGTENLLLTGILSEIISNNWQDDEFINKNVTGFEELKDSINNINIDDISVLTGVPLEDISKTAKIFASSFSSAILYSLDNIPSTQTTNTVELISNLTLVAGNLGKPSSGIFPLRSGTNEQGGMDVGCHPEFLPGYKSVSNKENIEYFENAWGTDNLPAHPGFKASDALAAMQSNTIQAAILIGDSPLYNDDTIHALSHLDFLVVQEMFLTDLASTADIILPMTSFAEQNGTYTNLERRIQKVNLAVSPRGESRTPSQFINELANEMQSSIQFSNENPIDIFDEIKNIMDIYSQINIADLGNDGIQWPCNEESPNGTSIMYEKGFTNKKGILFSIDPEKAPLQSKEFPFLHIPGRILFDPNTDIEIVLSGRKNAISREEAIEFHPDDAKSLSIAPGDSVEISTPYSVKYGKARLTGTLKGAVSSTALFGELVTEMDQSSDLEPTLRLSTLDIMPARIKKIT